MKTTRLRLLALLLLSAFSLQAFSLCCALRAQQVAQPSITAPPMSAPAIPVVITPIATPIAPPAGLPSPAATGGDIVELDPFTVNPADDDGYAGRDTTSGLRVRSSLRDTAATISVFTEEFLRDIGAQSIDEMINFSGNAEEDLDDATDSFGSLDSRSAGPGSVFRNRGITASLSVDGAQNGAPVDLYNVDRAEIASGANSILFGMDSQGGTINLSTQGANLQRNTLKVVASIGTWTSPGVSGLPYQRLTYNYNVVLMPRTWAIRVSGILQDGGQNTWRKWMGYHQKRINPVTTIKPFKNTTIKLAFEKGQITEGISVRWNGTDGITGWLFWRENDPAAGDGIMKGTGGAYVPPAISLPDPTNNNEPYAMSPITSAGGGFFYVSNNEPGGDTVYNGLGSYRSNHLHPTTRTNNLQYRLPENLSSYYFSTLGPGGARTNNFDRYTINLQQRIAGVSLEFVYNRNRNKSTAYANGANEPILYADVGPTISPATAVTTADNIPNPFAGRYYMQCGWMKTVVNRTNELYRLTGEYTLDLKKFGRHRIVTLLEHTKNDNYRDRLTEVLLDDDQYAYAYGAPDSGSGLGRRNYAINGDFSTYHMGDPGKPLTNIQIGSRNFHSAYVTINRQNGHVKGTTTGASLATQNYFFRDRLVTTLGLRVDRATYEVEGLSRAEPGDPRVLNKTKAVNELALDGTWTPRPTVTPYTFTTGAVYHATKRLSLTGNYSTNRGAPRMDGRTVLPGGDLPGPTRGTTLDYGVVIDPLGNGKILLQVTRFNTRQFGDAAVGGIDGDASAVVGGEGAGAANLGSPNLFNIYDALYFLTPTAAVGDNTYFRNPGVWMDGTGPGKGPMSASEYAATAPSNLYQYGHPPVYTAATIDTKSEGYEVNLTARPTNSITLRLTYSYTQRERTNLLSEIFDFYNTNIPRWFAMAESHNPDPASDGKYWVIDNTVANPVPVPLLTYIRNQLYGNGSVRSNINTQLFNLSTILGQRPHRLTFTAKYAVQEGLLKGLTLGNSIRWRSPNRMIDPYNRSIAAALALPPASVQDLYIDPDMYFNKRNTLQGSSHLFIDPFISYKCKLFGGKTNLTLQLNINNLMNKHVVTVAAMTVDSIPRRIYLAPPRTFRLTATLDF